MLDRYRLILLNPSKMYEIARYEDMNDPFKLYAFTSMIFIVLQSIVFLLIQQEILEQVFRALIVSYPLSIALVMIAIILYVTILLIPFAYSIFLHAFVKLFRGKHGYTSTYKAVAYSSIPTLLFAWIPFAIFITMLYSFYLLILGIARLHDISMLRALLAIITPSLIMIATILALLASNILTLPDIPIYQI